ncbi:hypothetical protein OZJ72_20575 [Escherichia coli]|nr:hypothetical protein [Escherichia coli]MCZ0586356.1 hypothetical protein [Escherichia coli]MCZ0609331.1 hypothetical protein [Escherichia coli]
MSIKNDGHYFCRAGGNRPDGLNEPVTFQVGSIEEIADALEKRSGSEEKALAMLAMTAFTLMTRRGICEMQNVAPDGKGIRLELIGFRENETIPDTLH